jgi:hypothetical protein
VVVSAREKHFLYLQIFLGLAIWEKWAFVNPLDTPVPNYSNYKKDDNFLGAVSPIGTILYLPYFPDTLLG